jgi:hypothetical protein
MELHINIYKTETQATGMPLCLYFFWVAFSKFWKLKIEKSGHLCVKDDVNKITGTYYKHIHTHRNYIKSQNKIILTNSVSTDVNLIRLVTCVQGYCPYFWF